MLSGVFLGSFARAAARVSRGTFLLQVHSQQRVPPTMAFARRGIRGLYPTSKGSPESNRTLTDSDNREYETLDSRNRETGDTISWWEVGIIVLLLWTLAVVEEDRARKGQKKETKQEPKKGLKEEPRKEPPQPKAQRTKPALHEMFDEQVKKLASNAATFNLDIDDYMKRKIVGVWVAQEVQLPDPTDIRSIHKYLKAMVVVMDLINSGMKPGQGSHREIVEIFDFEPRTLRKLVKSSPDPSMFRFAKKAEKLLYDIQLQACWDIYNVLHPESGPNPETDTRTQQMYELYVEEVLEVIMNSIRDATNFTPVFKDVIERAKDIEEMRRSVRKHPMWLVPGSGNL